MYKQQAASFLFEIWKGGKGHVIANHSVGVVEEDPGIALTIDNHMFPVIQHVTSSPTNYKANYNPSNCKTKLHAKTQFSIMARSQNPMDQHRRAERKKQVTKNKTKRLKERYAKVAATQSVDAVQKEIKALERKETFQEGRLDNVDTKKLERLKKELGIVKAAEEQRAAEKEEERKLQREQERKRMRTKEGVHELNEEKFKFAKYSVYYDEVMNPFGAPPPGQPALYWKEGGGKTMHIEEANIPQSLRDSLESQQKKAGKKRRQRKWDDDATTDGQDEVEDSLPESTLNVNIPLQQAPPSPPPPPPRATEEEFKSNSHSPPPPPPPPLPSEEPAPPPPPPKPSGPPAPPPPSKSVQRLNKRKLKGKKASVMADIWASNEELIYDTISGNGIPIEGIVTDQQEQGQQKKSQQTFKKRKKNGKEGERFDPLCPSGEGYSDYRSEEQIIRSTVQAKEKLAEMKKAVGAPDMWYYRDASNALQGPFNSVQMNGWKQAGFFPGETPVRRGIDGHFVPMGTLDFMKPPATDGEIDDSNNDDIQSRIEALKEKDNDKNGIEDRVRALRGNAVSAEKEEEKEVTLQERIKALRGANSAEQQVEGKEEAVIIHEENNEEQFGIDEKVKSLRSARLVEQSSAWTKEGDLPRETDNENESKITPDSAASYPLTASYPIQKSLLDSNEAPAYPVDDNNEFDDSTGNIPYPVGSLEDGENIPYPTDVAYGDTCNGFAYPDTDAAYNNEIETEVAPYYYPEEHQTQIAETELKPVPKKKYTGDKAIVGLVPTNLQVRRGQSVKKNSRR